MFKKIIALFLRRKFGVAGALTPSNTFATVGITSGKIITANSAISQITFSNDSANNIYLSKGVAAVVGSGIFLAANGGTHTMVGGSSNIWRGDIFAIASAASSNLAICIEYNLV